MFEPNVIPLESAFQENYDVGIPNSVPKTGDYHVVWGIAASLSQIIGTVAVTVAARKKIKNK